jgi:hypothetical protein
MKAMFNMKMTGANDRMKFLTFMVLSAGLAMAWVFVEVGNQVEIDQARFAGASEQMVLSQSLAKYALAATTGDTDAFHDRHPGISCPDRSGESLAWIPLQHQ